MTEVGSCWKSLCGGALSNEEEEATWRKIDWIVSCHRALLYHFPHATVYIVHLADIYMRLLARTNDEVVQCGDFGRFPTLSGQAWMLHNNTHNSNTMGKRWKYYSDELDKLFETYLGVTSGSPALHGYTVGDTIDALAATTIEGAKTILPQFIHSVPLWNVYIRKCHWDAAHSAAAEFVIPPPPVGYQPNITTQVSVLLQRYEESLRIAFKGRREMILTSTEKAFECALAGGAGYLDQNQVIWRNYTNFCKSWTDPIDCAPYVTNDMPAPPVDPGYEVAIQQKQLTALRSVYQRGITHPMLGLDQYWQEYEQFERQHSEALANVLIAEWLPKYQHARGVFLERGRVWNAAELKGGRLAVPPVGFGETLRAGAGGGGSGGATTAVIAEDLGDATTMGANKPTNEAEYIQQMEEEQTILSKWRRRAGYERTNPERLNSSDLIARVRTGYIESACAFGRHPEIWYEWSQWELLHGSSVAASVSVTPGQQNAPTSNGVGNVSSAVLMTPAKAGDLKSGGNAIRALAVLTLGMESLPDCALLAQAQADILERHLGDTTDVNGESGSREQHGCIKVMERFVSRSPTTLGFVLLQRLIRRYEGINAARAVFSRARRTLKTHEKDEMEGEDEPTAEGTSDGAKKMVTSRLKGTQKLTASDESNAGFITWHLFAAHATIEHRIGKNPQIAARIYELGLRKHRSFISTPPYVLHYASLLLELNDEENLRSLLMRAVAACEEEDESNADSKESDAGVAARRREVQRPLWDMMLKFESILSSRANNGNIAADVAAIEVRRRRALYGEGNEDVVMGKEGPPGEEDLSIGVQKSSLNEQLIRLEGYDVASRISNGMARMVDVLTVTGAIGNGEFDISSLDFESAASASLAAAGNSSNVWGDICAGGASDVSYVQRLRFQRESRTRAATSALGGAGGGVQGIAGGTKLLSAKERAAGAALGMGMNAMVIQSAPEWFRPLLLLLPPIPKFGRGLQKPPPHLVEMTLLTLKQNALPATRPVVAATATNGTLAVSNKRARDANGEDSSDDEEDGAGGGYSNQFRARQRARLVADGSAAS